MGRNTTKAKEETENIEVNVEETEVQDKVNKRSNKSIIPKEVDPNEYITVRNGFQGQLVYISKRTGEQYVWDSFGAEQEIELRELKSAKNSNKKFFTNNWFMFDDAWVIDYLGVRQYYKNALSIDGFDDIFKQSPSELKDTISKLSAGQKRSVAYRAKELIAEKKIDSLSSIATLEDALGIELVEK